jgi:hypothetical protein
MEAMSEPQRQHLDARRVLRVRTSHCPYCFGPLTPEVPQDEDHVIGRRFVPVGSLAAAWNLLLTACRDCNAEKAVLEGEISAATLHQLAFGSWAEELGPYQDRVIAETQRKARVRNSITRRFMAESTTEHTIRGQIGPMSVSFGLVGPPQLAPDAFLQLAGMQVKGLSVLVFSGRNGGEWRGTPSQFALAVECGRSDWGSDRARWSGLHFGRTPGVTTRA